MDRDNMDYTDKYEYLLKVLTEMVEVDGKKTALKDDFDKFFVKSNKTAGVRIRKVMQIIRRTAEEIRQDVQNYKKTF
jgi:hypothetical protein